MNQIGFKDSIGHLKTKNKQMKLLTRILKRFSRIFRIIVSINWIRCWKLYHSKSEIILWIPRPALLYFGTDTFIWDMATVGALVAENKKFRIVTGKKIGRYHGHKIFFSINSGYNIYGFDDYTNILLHITRQLEIQGNEVFPRQCETIFWENKTYMHQRFYMARVHEPRTRIFDSMKHLLNAKLKFPYLIKAEHSCSSEGVYKITDFCDLARLMADENFMRMNRHIIAQELINMRRDLRVILVNGEIVLHYWRINKEKEWKPTSTSYGSEVDFDFFPEQWRQHIIDTFYSLELTTGAFDITWQDDDLSTEPIYLEVSPFYQPNPKMEVRKKAYAFYKQHFSLFNSWDSKYVDVVFRIKQKQVKAYLSPALL